MTSYVMHDTYGTVNLRCSGMEKKPKIKVTTLAEARTRYNARQCALCIPFAAPDRTVVVEKREP